MVGYSRYRRTKIKSLKMLTYKKVIDVLRSKAALRISQQCSCTYLNIKGGTVKM